MVRYHLRHFNISNLANWSLLLYFLGIVDSIKCGCLIWDNKKMNTQNVHYNFSGNTNLLSKLWYVQNRCLDDNWSTWLRNSFENFQKFFKNNNAGTRWHISKKVDICRRQWNSQKSEFSDIWKHFEKLFIKWIHLFAEIFPCNIDF